MNRQTPYLLGTDSLEPSPQAHRLLVISEKKKSGLILCKGFHAEFAGPGAVVSTAAEQKYTGILAIGSPEIVEVVSPKERQTAYSRRIQWMRWLQRNTDHVDPPQRAEKLFFSFEAFFGHQILASLSDDVLAMLVGVLPQTIATVRSQHPYLGRVDEPEVGLTKRAEPAVLTLDPHSLSLFNTIPTPFVISANLLEALYPLPCSA